MQILFTFPPLTHILPSCPLSRPTYCPIHLSENASSSTAPRHATAIVNRFRLSGARACAACASAAPANEPLRPRPISLHLVAMYSHRAVQLPADAKPFENRALFNAVCHISSSLVQRAGVNARHSPYANLLAHIWGQSHYATIEVLVEKRKQLAEKLTRKPPDQKRLSRVSGNDLTAYLDSNGTAQHHVTDPDLSEKIRRKNAARDKLVTLLKAVKDDDITLNERKLTMDILQREGTLHVDDLRRLWGVPKVVFEAANLHPYFESAEDTHLVLDFYQTHVMRASPDSRIFNILYWMENFNPKTGWKQGTPQLRKCRTVSKHTIAHVIRLLLTKRRSPFYEKNMDVVIETVLYAIHPDRFVDKFREPALRRAQFFQGLQGYEYSRSFTGSLENLHLGKLNRMLKDIRAVRSIEGGSVAEPGKQGYLSLRAISEYCAERDTLTDRALRGVHDRYVRCRGCSVRNAKDVRMTVADFVRMYLALVGCGTDRGLKYWFSILDQDGDGWVGVTDVAHFYAERKIESEKRNGIVLADAQCLWIRLCAMLGVPPNGKGLNLNSLTELGREEREFVMCALLVRRADDGNLINVAATVSSDPDRARTL